MSIRYRLARQARDNVAVLQTGLGRRRTLLHLGYQHAFLIVQTQARSHFGIEILDRNAEIATMHRAVLEQLRGNIAGHVRSDGQTDALPAAGAALDRRIDADHFAAEIDQRTAAVAGIDGRVRLQKVFIHIQVQIAALGADDARGYGAGQAERSADGQYAIANLHLGAVAELQVRQRLLGFDADDGQVGLGIALDVLGREFAS